MGNKCVEKCVLYTQNYGNHIIRLHVFFKFRSVSLYILKKCTKCEASVHLSADGAFRDGSHANITIR